MGKAFKPVIVYGYSRSEKVKTKNRKTYMGNIPHSTKELAEEELVKTILDLKKRDNFILVSSEIEEYEIEDNAEIIGKINEKGDWEDYAQYIDEKRLYEIFDKFMSRKIKITIELLD